jgi:hypothetical protein
MIFDNPNMEPTELEIYFLELHLAKSENNFALLDYLVKRDYKQEAVTLLRNGIDLESTLFQFDCAS